MMSDETKAEPERDEVQGTPVGMTTLVSALTRRHAEQQAALTNAFAGPAGAAAALKRHHEEQAAALRRALARQGDALTALRRVHAEQETALRKISADAGHAVAALRLFHAEQQAAVNAVNKVRKVLAGPGEALAALRRLHAEQEATLARLNSQNIVRQPLCRRHRDRRSGADCRGETRRTARVAGFGRDRRHRRQRGVDLLTVQKLGGWRTLSMVQRYGHLAPDHLRAAAERLVRSELAAEVTRK